MSDKIWFGQTKNFRYLKNRNQITISIDEATDLENIHEIVEIFSNSVDKKFNKNGIDITSSEAKEKI